MTARFLPADRPERWTPHPSPPPGKQLYLLSESYLVELRPEARLELRSKSRGLLLLESMLEPMRPFHPETGLYLACLSGPFQPRAQQAALAHEGPERMANLDRALPPKDYFISNPSMKAGQLSIDFGLHGPWTVFTESRHGFAQAARFARLDLEDGVVPAALLACMFLLDEPLEWPGLLGEEHEYRECLFAQYAENPAELPTPPGDDGVYGPLTALMEGMEPAGG